MNHRNLGNKGNTLLITIVIIAIIGIAWLYIANKDKGNMPDQSVNESITSTTTPENIADGNTEPASLMEDGVIEETNTVTITYTDRGFSLEQIEIPIGTAIAFVNESRDPMWVSTNVHPIHTAYPGSDIRKCGSEEESKIFDQCEGGNNYTFIFNELGTWGYHNHLRPGDGGTIIVK